MFKYPLLVPDLPSAHELLPLLEQIDQNRQYSNFGPLVRSLEADLAAWIGETSGREVATVTVSTGTEALELPLAALGLPAGARVLVPGLTFPASALAVIHAGLQPVFCDVDPRSWQLTVELAREIECEAVLPVATYGLPIATEPWDKFTRDTGRPVLIDAASALGQQAVGEHTAVAFSLHATKPFGCGEGGLVSSTDAALLQRIRSLSNFGFQNKRSVELGTNAKLSEYAAAVALAQLARREHLIAARRRIWRAYRTALALVPGVCLQENPHNLPPSVLCVELDQPVAPIQVLLERQGIETRQWYCPPLPQHPALSVYPVAGSLTVCERLSERLLGLPFHHHLTETGINEIACALGEAIDSTRKESA